MRLDAATAEVVGGLGDAGIDVVILKGPSLVGWLYDTDASHYADSDLLISPDEEDRAGGVLVALGFERAVDDRGLPAWWLEHSTEWVRHDDAVTIDLHRRLVGVGVTPAVAWPQLVAGREQIVLAQARVPVLAPPARLFHVVLHAAQHGAGRGGRAIQHVERALERIDASVWTEAAQLAARLDAVEPFAAGLRLARGGTSLADQLGLPEIHAVDVALRATSPPPVALGFEQLAQAQGISQRIGMALRKLFPPRGFLEHWDPRVGDSRVRLLLARIRRPFWVLRSAPAGFRAWRVARRDVTRH